MATSAPQNARVGELGGPAPPGVCPSVWPAARAAQPLDSLSRGRRPECVTRSPAPRPAARGSGPGPNPLAGGFRFICDYRRRRERRPRSAGTPASWRVSGTQHRPGIGARPPVPLLGLPLRRRGPSWEAGGPQRRTSAVCCRPVAGHAAAPGHTAPGVRSAPPCGETRRGTWLCVGPSPPERPLRKEQPRRRGPGPCPGPRLGPPLSVRRPPGPAPQTSRPLPAVCRRPARAAARGARLRVPPPQRAAPATARHGPSATLTRRCCSLPIVFTHIFLKLRRLRF